MEELIEVFLELTLFCVEASLEPVWPALSREPTPRMRRLKRVIQWDDALFRLRNGRGLFVHCETNGGRYWWVPTKPGATDTESDYVDVLRKEGLLLDGLPPLTVKQLEALSEIRPRLRWLPERFW